MKITKYILIGFIAFVVGLTGLIICLVPSSSGADRTVSKYVSAINSGNVEKMQKCMISASDILGSYGNAIDDAINGSESADTEGDKKLNALKKSDFDFSAEDVKKVKSVKLVGCVDGTPESAMGMTGLVVTAVVEITYENDEGDEKTVFDQEDFSLVKAKGGYKIAG